MTATAIKLYSHIPISSQRRDFYSRVFQIPTIPSGFMVLASENNLSFKNKSFISYIGSDLGKKPLWSASEIAEAVNGKIIKWGPSGTICTDTRNLKTGQWFFAIVGENFDGHDFVNHDLCEKGCVGVVGNRVCEKWSLGFIEVEGNTLFVLQKMAKYARDRFHGCIVGVTGSVGKTTTRTMIALALENLGLVYQTHGNQNNEVGVALTLVGIPENVGMLVLELGMSRKGEILELARICRPSVRVILNVGPSHLENFTNLEEIGTAKGEILKEAKPGDVCVLNADDPLVMNQPVPDGVKKVLFGRRVECDVRLVLAESADGGNGVRVIFESIIDMVEFVIPSPGVHLALNACAAAAVAVSMGVPLPQVAVSLSRFRPVHMRSELEIGKSGIRIINDVYNANPTSTKAAIDLLKAIECRGKKVAILGDMLELGLMEIEAHKTVLNLCCDANLGLVAIVGKRFLAAAEDFNLVGKMNIISTLDAEALALSIRDKLTTNDVVLVKGSRGMQMEKIVDAIKAIHVGILFE